MKLCIVNYRNICLLCLWFWYTMYTVTFTFTPFYDDYQNDVIHFVNSSHSCYPLSITVGTRSILLTNIVNFINLIGHMLWIEMHAEDRDQHLDVEANLCRKTSNWRAFKWLAQVVNEIQHVENDLCDTIPFDGMDWFP